MNKAASKLWKLATPWRANSVMAAIALKKLGTPDDLAAGLRKAAEVLGLASDKGGVLPASVEGPDGDVMVRQAVCPDTDAAVKLARQTAWCKRHQRRCVWLMDYNDDQNYVVCKAALLDEHTDRMERHEGEPPGTEFQAAKWYEMGGDQGQLPAPDWSMLSKILAVLGPVAALGYKRYRQKSLQEQLNPQEQEAHSLIRSVFKAEAIGFTWNKTLRRFNLVRDLTGKGYVEVHDDGEILIKFGGRTRIYKGKKRIDALFDLTTQITMLRQDTGQGAYR